MAELFVLIDVAIPCGLLLTELFTNSVKHAFPDEGKGEIFIRVTQGSDDEVVFHVADNGVGLADDFEQVSHRSIGLRVVRMIVEHQLKGTI